MRPRDPRLIKTAPCQTRLRQPAPLLRPRSAPITSMLQQGYGGRILPVNPSRDGARPRSIGLDPVFALPEGAVVADAVIELDDAADT